MKRVFFIFSIIVLFLSCKKNDDSSVFNIQLKEVTPLSLQQFQENISVEIIYEHPGGFLGLYHPDSLSLSVKDTRLDTPDYFHLIPLSPPNSDISIRGTIIVEIDSPFLFGNSSNETLSYKIRIKDRYGTWSNYVETPEINVYK